MEVFALTPLTGAGISLLEMIRNLGRLLSCVAAVAALVVVVAPTASAAEFEASEYPATVTATPENEIVISNGVRSVTCANIVMPGTLSGAAESIALTPSYANCTGNANTTATVTMNGCTYTFKAIGELNIDCPLGSNSIIDIWATGKKHTDPKMCRLEVPEQGPIKGLSYHNTTLNGKNAIKLTTVSSNFTVLRTEGSALNCGASHKDGTFTGIFKWVASLFSGAIDLVFVP
jgi:hypothetical protein